MSGSDMSNGASGPAQLSDTTAARLIQSRGNSTGVLTPSAFERAGSASHCARYFPRVEVKPARRGGPALQWADRRPVRGAGVQQRPGAYTMTWCFPVTVFLVADVCPNFGRAFCTRGECRSRPGMFRVCRCARAAALAAAAVAWRDEVAVTWVVSMERM